MLELVLFSLTSATAHQLAFPVLFLGLRHWTELVCAHPREAAVTFAWGPKLEIRLGKLSSSLIHSIKTLCLVLGRRLEEVQPAPDNSGAYSLPFLTKGQIKKL